MILRLKISVQVSTKSSNTKHKREVPDPSYAKPPFFRWREKVPEGRMRAVKIKTIAQ